MLLLNKSISKDCSNNLIEECFNVADTFLLTEGPDLYPEGKALLDALKPYLIKSIETNHWFSYYVPAPYRKKIYIFKKLLLGTVSHEYICYCYPPTDDINKYFKKYATGKRWTTTLMN